MADGMDPRTARARKAMIDAAMTLVAEKPVSDISITEAAEAAGVTRPTIYQHFGDVPGLAAAATEEYMTGVFERIDLALEAREGADGYIEDMLGLFVNELYANRAFCAHAMHGPSALAIAVDEMARLADRMRGHVIGSRIGAKGQKLEDRLGAISAGLVWMVGAWLATDFSGENEPDAFSARLADTLFSLSG